jgi:ElaA protein
MEEGIALYGDAPITLGAQAYLEHWYARFGFGRSGPDYLEDGIPHLPMRRDPA